MRSELGKITLDKTFEERDTLNENIVVRSFFFFTFEIVTMNSVRKTFDERNSE